MKWRRIPVPIEADADRRALVGILASAGLEVRVAKEQMTKRGAIKRFVEYREQTEKLHEHV